MVASSRPHQHVCTVAVIAGISLFLIINSIVNILPPKFWKSPVVISQSDSNYVYSGSIAEIQRLSYDEDSIEEIVGNDVSGSDDFYGVIFDAGSTGSRVHVLHFRSQKGSHPILVAEQFNYTTHGLSEYAVNPEEGAMSIKGLLAVAQNTVPTEKWLDTPIALKATAGLRLLPKEQGDALLEAAYQLLADSGFHIEVPEKTISIMDGDEEGEYIWLTLNFLLGALDSSDISNTTMGVLDLGGGSTQIAFIPTHQATFDEGRQRGYIKDFRYMNSKFELYTHSYLGLGMVEARLNTMKIDNGILTSTESSQVDEGDGLWSSCLPPNTTASWMFGGHRYTARSALLNPSELYEKCRMITLQFLSEQNMHSPEEIHGKDFYAMSYFYARGTDLGLIDGDKGGVITVQNEIDAAKEVCNTASLDEPFLCMDQVFISSLLSSGYKLHPDVKLHISPTINGFEVSWALGAVIDILHTHWDHLAAETESYH